MFHVLWFVHANGQFDLEIVVGAGLGQSHLVQLRRLGAVGSRVKDDLRSKTKQMAQFSTSERLMERLGCWEALECMSLMLECAAHPRDRAKTLLSPKPFAFSGHGQKEPAFRFWVIAMLACGGFHFLPRIQNDWIITLPGTHKEPALNDCNRPVTV